MIKWLKIKNYAIIDELKIDFSKGLTIITGETGAGKSILLGALGLLMGKRADTKSLYDESKKCVIEGEFNIRNYDLKDFFEENDIDFEEDLIMRRELTPSGKSRSFVNDTPANLKIMQALSAYLIDLHQQFDTQAIHEQEFQLQMLDALAANKTDLKAYQKDFKKYKEHKSRLEKLLDQNARAAQEMDFLNFQLEELNEADLLPNEQEQLEAELKKLSNAEGIKQTLSAANLGLSESEQAIIGQLEEINIAIGQVKEFDANTSKIYDRMASLILELEDISGACEQVAENTEYDGERIGEAQNRLDVIYRLQQKHNVQTVDALIQIQAELETRYHSFADLSSEIEHLKAKIAKAEEQLQKQAEKLSAGRKAVAPKFEKNILSMLSDLGMEHSQLSITFDIATSLTNYGLDEVNYLFAANKGSRLQAIKDVASGGEQSRLALVTKSLVASSISLPTLIFDEIDTGISGAVALKMGYILRRLSNQHQVVSITHSPQVASKADTHYFVYKGIKDERTVTNVRQLQKQERVEAIAVMLSTDPPSKAAIKNAKELLDVKKWY